MNPIQTPTSSHRTETSSKETPTRSKHERFRKHLREKVEKSEEREQKKPSIFDLVSEGSPPLPPIPLFVEPNKDLGKCSVAAPLDENTCAMIIEQAVHEITHLVEKGNKETTLLLGGEIFEKSPLNGIELVIKEFSTAPLAFNIAFRCSPAALAHLQPHLPTLIAAFHQEKRVFEIHRVDAELQDTPHFLFSRKPPAGGQKQRQNR